MKERKLRKNDILLIGILLVISGLLFFFAYIAKDPGGSVTISIDGLEIMELPLKDDIRIELSSEHGLEEGHRNTLHIKEGKAYITDANCPDKVCENKGSVCYVGETLVCLPHKLVIKVTEGIASDMDGVAG